MRLRRRRLLYAFKRYIIYLALFGKCGAWAASDRKIIAPEVGIGVSTYETSKIAPQFNDFVGGQAAIGFSILTQKPNNWAWGVKILSTQGKDEEQRLQMWSLGLMTGYRFGETFYFHPSLIAGMSFVSFTHTIHDMDTENVEMAYSYSGQGFFLGPRGSLGLMITPRFSVNVWAQYQYHLPGISDPGMEAFDNTYAGIGFASTF